MVGGIGGGEGQLRKLGEKELLATQFSFFPGKVGFRGADVGVAHSISDEKEDVFRGRIVMGFTPVGADGTISDQQGDQHQESDGDGAQGMFQIVVFHTAKVRV